jgi:hypothetical protein
MALLRQKLKMAGNLAGTSQEETQQLAQAAGRQAAPTTPQETAVIGGNPDQAKMAGSSAQKQAALRMSIQQDRNLSDVQRREQARTQQTGQEAATAAKGQKLQGLSGLQGRVANLTKQMLTQGQQAAAPATLQVDQTKLSAIPPESQAEATALLQKLSSNTATPADILKLNQLSGKTTAADMLTAEQLKGNFLGAGASVGQNLAQSTADTVQVSQLQPAELGFADMSELAATLGVDEAELGNMSIEQLQETSRKQFEQEFNRVGALEQQANDPNLGPAERAEARKSLKDAGATGVRSIETDADKLADQIANADEIEFNGEQVPVSELLKDEMISGLAARYLDAPEGDPFLEEFKANEPELAKFFDDNQAMLKQATAELDADVAAFAEIQKANLDVGKLPGGPELSKDIVQAIFPNYGQLADAKYDLTAVPTLQYLKDESVPAALRTNVQAGLTEIAQANPNLVASFASLTPDELAQLGVTAGTGNPKWDTTRQAIKDASNMNSISAANPDTIASTILGPGKTYADLKVMADRLTAQINSGLVPDGPMSKQLIAAIRQGPEAAAAAIKASSPALTDMRALVANTPFSISQNASQALTHAERTNPVFDIVAPYFVNGKELDLKAGADILKKHGVDGLEIALSSRAMKQRLSPGLQEKGAAMYREVALPQLNSALSSSKFYNTRDLDKLIGLNAPPLRDDVKLQRINSSLQELKKQLGAVNKVANPMKHKLLSDLLDRYQGELKRNNARVEKEDTKESDKQAEISKLKEQIRAAAYQTSSKMVDEQRKARTGESGKERDARLAGWKQRTTSNLSALQKRLQELEGG